MSVCFPFKLCHSCRDRARSWGVLFSGRCKPHPHQQAHLQGYWFGLVWFHFQHRIQKLYLPRKEINSFLWRKPFVCALEAALLPSSSPPRTNTHLSSDTCQQLWGLHYSKPRSFSPSSFLCSRLLPGSPFPWWGCLSTSSWTLFFCRRLGSHPIVPRLLGKLLPRQIALQSWSTCGILASGSWRTWKVPWAWPSALA